MGKRHWLIIVVLTITVLWVQAEVDRWRLRAEIKRVYLGNVTVQAIDADTKIPVPITFTGPTMGMDQRWPKAFTVSSPGDLKIAIRWIDVGDVSVGVSAEGYEPVPLTLNAATARELVIPLRRAGH